MSLCAGTMVTAYTAQPVGFAVLLCALQLVSGALDEPMLLMLTHAILAVVALPLCVWKALRRLTFHTIIACLPASCSLFWMYAMLDVPSLWVLPCLMCAVYHNTKSVEAKNVIGVAPNPPSNPPIHIANPPLFLSLPYFLPASFVLWY